MDLGTPTATKVVGAIALLVVAALGWTVVGRPARPARWRGPRGGRQPSRTRTRVLAAAARRARAAAATSSPATRRTAAQLAEKFPPTADQPGLFEAVTAAAVDAGIGADGVTTLAPTPPMIGTAAGGAAPEPPTPPTTGPRHARPADRHRHRSPARYDETQRLLENLEHMSPRLPGRPRCRLTGDPETGTYTTTVTGDMFVMPPVVDPGKTVNLASTTEPEE